jgi:ribosomal protein L39E
MARYNPISKKMKLAKLNRRTKWAPFWVIPKIFGVGRKIHPGRVTKQKRSWKRSKTKV